MPRLTTNIHLAGNAREAIGLYASALGVEITTLMTEQP